MGKHKNKSKSKSKSSHLKTIETENELDETIVVDKQQLDSSEPQNQELENQELENQELENQELENQEIENQELENQELENQELEDSQDTVDNSNTKKTRKVIVFSEEVVLYEKLLDEETKLREKKEKLLKDYESSLKEINSQMKKIRRDQNATFLKIKSSHDNEVKAASKEKRKRNGKNKGGFNKEAPVPKILQKFLGLDKKKLYPRSELYHLLNEKLKERGCKNGQWTELDDKTADELMKPRGTKFPLKGGQPFLKSFFTEESNVNV